VSGRWSGSADRGPLVFTPDGPDGAGMAAPGRPAAFLDRDGTLNEAVPDPDSGMPESPLSVDDVRLLPGAAAAAGRLADAGYALVCASNQPAAAKGKLAVEELLAVHERVLGLLAQQGVRIEISMLCLHHPDGVLGELSGPCPCRKPAPGMLLDAAAALELDLQSSWMLGDTDADVAAGHAAGARTVLIEYPRSAHKRSGGSTPELLASDIGDAAAQLLDQPPR
jgi:D-glycero-D-manno-heptose 1,7-bisphosphate phosphatase